MKRIVWIVIILVVALAGWRVVQRRGPGDKAQTARKKLPLVSVTLAQKGTITDVISATGVVEAKTIVDILPKLEQQIVWMPNREGDRVTAGQTLVRLNTTEVSRQIEQALAEQKVAAASLRDLLAGSRAEEIAQARAQLEQAKATQAKAEASLRNLRVLYAEGGIPRQMADEAEGRVRLNKAQALSAEVQVADAELELERVRQVVAIGGAAKQDADRAQTRLSTAKAQLQAATAALEASQAALKHIRELYGGPIPRRELDEAEGRVKEAAAGVQAAEQKLNMLRSGPTPTQIALAREKVAQAASKVSSARVVLQYCTIVSPVSGVVVKRYADVGDMATPRSAILAVAATDDVVVRAGVSENDAARLRPGSDVQVLVDGWGTRALTLKVARIYPSTDPVSRLIPVEIALPRTSARPALGSLARLSFVQAVRRDVVVIPAGAVVQRAGGKRVAFVVGADSKVSERELVIGIQNNDRLEVLSGVEAGEKLVVRGQEMLKDAIEVKVMQPKAGAGAAGGAGPKRSRESLPR